MYRSDVMMIMTYSVAEYIFDISYNSGNILI